MYKILPLVFVNTFMTNSTRMCYSVLILFLMSPLIFWVDSLNNLQHSQSCYTSQNHVQSLMVHYQYLGKVQSSLAVLFVVVT